MLFVVLLCTVVLLPRAAVAQVTCTAPSGQFITSPSPPFLSRIKLVQNQTSYADAFTLEGYFTLDTNWFLISPNGYGAELYLTDGTSPDFDLVMGPGMYNIATGKGWSWTPTTWRYRENTPTASIDVRFKKWPASAGAPPNSVRVRVEKAMYVPHIPFNFSAPLTVTVVLNTRLDTISGSVDCASIEYSATECLGSSSASIGCFRP